MTTAQDYAWVQDDWGPFNNGYRLALAHGCRVSPSGPRVSYDEVCGPVADGRSAITMLGDWAVLLDDMAARTMTTADVGALGDRVLLHARDVNALDDFQWHVDSRMLLQFPPLSAAFERYGEQPDGYLDDMRAAGFDLSQDDDADPVDAHPAAFALGERLTGVRLTPDIVESASYVLL